MSCSHFEQGLATRQKESSFRIVMAASMALIICGISPIFVKNSLGDGNEELFGTLDGKLMCTRPDSGLEPTKDATLDVNLKQPPFIGGITLSIPADNEAHSIPLAKHQEFSLTLQNNDTVVDIRSPLLLAVPISYLDLCIRGASQLEFKGIFKDQDCQRGLIKQSIDLHLFETDYGADQNNYLSGDFHGKLNCYNQDPSLVNKGCIIGTSQDNALVGTPNNDCVDGKGGNDKIAGLAGNDKISGGDGKDLLSGGIGNDILTGGKGSDKFQCGAGKDKITDFKTSEGDKKTSDCEQF